MSASGQAGLDDHDRRRPELSWAPQDSVDWVIFVVAVLFGLLGCGVIATSDGGLGGALGLAALTTYGVISGRLGLRRGHNLRDRFLLLFGEVLGVATILGLALRAIAG